MLALFLFLFSSVSLAGGLDDYKDQKHGESTKVTNETCESEYIKRCKSECAKDDKSCFAECKQEAPGFCEERRKRKAKKTAGVVAKGGSVAAGGVAVATTKAVLKRKGVEDTREAGPYTIYYMAPSLIAEGGGGFLAGGIGAGTANVQARFGPVGVGGMTSYLNDGSDWLAETDVGPAGYIAGGMLMYGLQPSLLISQGNDVETEYGFGVRSYTTLYAGQIMGHFDPMLGYINGQWNYHLRVGASYRITPGAYVRVSYDYRDIVDLNDLDISQARLQGVMLTVGGRFN